MAINQQEYYDDSSRYGEHQYVSLDNIINNFMLSYVGDDKLINNTDRFNVIFHAKRGLQELKYDALKEIKAIEIDLSDSLRIILPDDYVNYVRISWVDDKGNFRPMIENRNTIISKSYLQDNEFEILFDDDGRVLEANRNSYSQTLPKNNFNYPLNSREYLYSYYKYCGDWYDSTGVTSSRYGLDTSRANKNGWFTVNKRLGVIDFSSIVEEETLVIEYISDGLEFADDSDIKVHKFAEECLYNYIKWCLLDNRIGVQEYVVRRARREYYNSRRIAKGRIQGLKYNELVQAIRGRDKWIK